MYEAFQKLSAQWLKNLAKWEVFSLIQRASLVISGPAAFPTSHTAHHVELTGMSTQGLQPHVSQVNIWVRVIGLISNSGSAKKTQDIGSTTKSYVAF